MAKFHPVHDFAAAENTAKRYVCSTCFGSLAIRGVDGQVGVSCRNPDCDGGGFVTRAYADRRRAESQADLAEARRNLKGLIPPSEFEKSLEGKTVDELINSIF
jgi:hypothetical protein